ncbi:MAG: rhomboid family intramembrane serine protease, partial [Sphingobacterium sp.]
MMKKESGLQTFIRTTFKNGSPIPYLLSIQIFLFVFVHISDLLVDLNLIKFPLYDWLLSNLSLPSSFAQFIKLPWSIITYSFLYVGLFNIVFDCLWLYWLGNIFLNLLHPRQFLVLYLGSIVVGGVIYLLLGEIGIFSAGPISSLYSNSLGLAALIASLLLLAPQTEIRLFLFGLVRLQTLAYIYLCVEILFYLFANRTASVTYLCCIGLG